MRKILGAMSLQIEVTIVLLVGFGWLTAISLMHLSGTLQIAGEVDQSLQLIVVEPLILIAIYVFLRLRGERFRLDVLLPKPLDLLYGCGLAGLAYFSYVMLWTLAATLLPDLSRIIDAGSSSPALASEPATDLTLISLAVVINAIFEELLLSGYLISRLRRIRPLWNAIHLSVMLRLLCHVDAGAATVLEVIPLGLVFAGWFCVTQQVWPLIIGHLLIDLLAVMA